MYCRFTCLILQHKTQARLTADRICKNTKNIVFPVQKAIFLCQTGTKPVEKRLTFLSTGGVTALHFAMTAKIRMLDLFAKTCRFVSWKTYAKTVELHGRYSP